MSLPNNPINKAALAANPPTIGGDGAEHVFSAEPPDLEALPVANAEPVRDLLAKREPDLAELEETIRQYERSSIEAGRALLEIRDRRLFASNYESFEHYVSATCRFDMRRAKQLIDGVDVVDTLHERRVTQLPVNEAQARPLVPLDDEERVAAWQKVLEEHSPTASKKTVEAVVAATLGESTASRVRNPMAGWESSAILALSAVPKKHRKPLAATVVAAGYASEDVTPEIVREKAEEYTVAILEDGAEPPDVATVLEEFAPRDESSTDERPSVIDLEAAADTPGTMAEAQTQIHPPKRKSHSLFLGAAEARPLLVALPTGIVPGQLLEAVPEHIRRDGASQVVVEVGELERAGGPVRGGILMMEEILAFLVANNIQKELQPTTESVDWARYTSNMITGCWHGCQDVFCYAAGIAYRMFAQGFLPTLYPARLQHFANTRLPDVTGLETSQAWKERSVFMVSMGEILATWIPDWYVELVLEEVRQHPGWFCFFLTKDPSRLRNFSFPPNCAVGITLTGDEPHGTGQYTQEQRERDYVRKAAQLGQAEGMAFKWISAEPLRGDVGDLSQFFDAGVKMVAVGGQTRSYLPARQPGESPVIVPGLQPELVWVDSIRAQCRAAGVSLFEKENLTVRPKEIPFPEGRPDEARAEDTGTEGQEAAEPESPEGEGGQEA